MPKYPSVLALSKERFIGFESGLDSIVQAAQLDNKWRHPSKPNTNRVRGRTRQAHVKICAPPCLRVMNASPRAGSDEIDEHSGGCEKIIPTLLDVVDGLQWLPKPGLPWIFEHIL